MDLRMRKKRILTEEHKSKIITRKEAREWL